MEPHKDQNLALLIIFRIMAPAVRLFSITSEWVNNYWDSKSWAKIVKTFANIWTLEKIYPCEYLTQSLVGWLVVGSTYEANIQIAAVFEWGYLNYKTSEMFAYVCKLINQIVKITNETYKDAVIWPH